jgi:RNA polymerase sigma-70 factor (subfamily 1)
MAIYAQGGYSRFVIICEHVSLLEGCDMSQVPPNLEKLIGAAKVGSKEALGQLLESYRPFLQIKARLYLDSRLSRKFDEMSLVQEAMLAACRCFAKFRGCTEQEIRAWLARILAHRAHDLSKRFHTRKRNVCREVRLTRPIAENLEARGLEHEKQLRQTRQQQTGAMRQAFGRLPTDYQTVINLHGKDGREFKEVAAIMDRSVAAVSKLWLRALRQWSKEAHMIYREMGELEQGMTG